MLSKSTFGLLQVFILELGHLHSQVIALLHGVYTLAKLRVVVISLVI